MHLRYPGGLSFHRRRDARAARQPLRRRCSAAPSSSATACTPSVSSPTSTSSTLGGGGTALPAPAAEAASLPVRFDIQVQAPQTLRVENNLRASRRGRGPDADRHLRSAGPARPRGRSNAARSSSRATGIWSRAAPSISSTPRAIQPFFDIEAETRVRVSERRKPTASPSPSAARSAAT